MIRMSSYWWLTQHAESPLLRVAVFEGPSSLDGDVSQNVVEVEHAMEKASREYNAHLLVFPELFLSGYGHSRDTTMSAARFIVDSQVIARLQKLACQYSIALFIGYPEKANETIYNSATLIDHQGEILINYRKTHLWAEKERHVFKEGNNLSPVVQLCGVRVGVMICYDVEMPEVARALSVLGAQLLLVATAEAASPWCGNVAHILVPARALENHVWVAYANLAPPRFAGLSRIVGPDGKELCRVEQDSIIVAELRPQDYLHRIQATPYLADRRPSLYSSISDTQLAIALPPDYKYTSG
ncbi:unnamed protein product [Rotaria sp. Silwood2]|nr:unnamed protein product [Rotaria sp. Silwood2]CAF2959079.1 unnamed protein product [Rotaria sp. Silwood2]CAF3229346.1 unnamed protein product [Rotaria sp. Silwood2]CAF3342569.1 unnamed protein product [Rotaria sp. Silwood2]CAF4167777.1 unnamed protein product [Rotaria sp. Silwood2]